MIMNEKIFCYPPLLQHNDYLKQNIKTWESLGYVVLPWTELLKKIMNIKGWRRDILVLNFYENIINGRFPVFRLFLAVFFLILSKLLTRKIVWVRHNFIPHEFDKKKSVMFEFFVRFIGLISCCTVTHRPTESIKADYIIPHPLYDHVITCDNQGENSEIRFLYFGQVRKYKGLVELLTNWPKVSSLLMLGYCSDSKLESDIRDIIKNRNLDVHWENGFVPKKDLDTTISLSQFVIIPHVDNSMVVTGALFHAMSLGANLLIKDGEFGRWAEEEYPFIHIYDDNSLELKLKMLSSVPKSEVIEFAKKNNGFDKQLYNWRKVFSLTP